MMTIINFPTKKHLSCLIVFLSIITTQQATANNQKIDETIDFLDTKYNNKKITIIGKRGTYTSNKDPIADKEEAKNTNSPSWTGGTRQANPLPEPPYDTTPSYPAPPPQHTPGVGPAGRRNTPNQYPTQAHSGLSVNPSICSPKAAEVGILHFKYNEPFASELVWSGFGSKNEEKYKIHRDAKDALHTLVNAAKADGIALKPSSIFRSIKRQQQIITSKLKTQDPYEVYYTSSPAGYSEHHTGFAVDFGSIDERFTTTRAYEWLLNNAYRYGWEQTFTTDYSAYSGVSEESWHWRYVGQNHEFSYLFDNSRNRAC